MAIPGTISALIAAFQFGIVVNAASVAVFLNVRGYGSSIFLDGKRLALIIFLLSAALWAQVDFITILIGRISATSCQIGISLTTVFDQLARYAIEQHLLWVVNAGTKPGAGQYIPQVLLVLRLILGGVFVGFTRHQLQPVCAPTSSIFALGPSVTAVDAALVVVLTARASSTRLFKSIKEGGQDSARGKAVIAVLVGIMIWTLTSVMMLLGIPTIDYILRSTVPGGGLAILILIVTATSSVLLDTKPSNRQRNLPEAPSPTGIDTRFISTSMDYPPSRYEDLKTEQVTSSTAFVQPREVPAPGEGLPNNGNAMEGQGFGGVPIRGQLFPPMRSTTAPASVPRLEPEEKPRTLFKSKSARKAPKTTGKFTISNPVLQEGGSNPLDKVVTIDLQTAVLQEKERRDRAARRSLSTIRSEDAAVEVSLMERVKRAPSTIPEESIRTSMTSVSEGERLVAGSATGAQLSPGGEDLRRRSPRHAPSASQDSGQSMLVSGPSRTPSPPMKSAARGLPRNLSRPNDQYPASSQPAPSRSSPEPAVMPLQRRATDGLLGNPGAMPMEGAVDGSEPQRQDTIMFVNNIVYDDPNFVASIMEDAKEQGSKAFTQRPIQAAPRTARPATTGFPETPGTSGSVVNRPRPIPRRSNTPGMDTTYFPGHRRSKSAGVLGQRKNILQSSPGSPTMLPPLPPPPQIPDMAARPKPNNTKSMTYDEKMTLLFPQSQNTNANRRRSSVPTLPATPNSFMGNSPTLTANDGRDTQWWGSKGTLSSVQTREQMSQEQEMMGSPSQQLNTRAYQDMADEMGGRPGEARNLPKIMKDGKRASSPVLPPRMSFRSATTMDDATVDWGAGYSPMPAQQVGLSVHQAREVEVAKADKSLGERAISAITDRSGEIGIMLDTSMARDIGPKPLPMTPVEKDSPATETMSTHSSGQWHRRVGDETLRFSSRSRRGTPPVPLVLSDRPTQAKQAALVKAAEPSPLPSPEEAFQMIQAQLKKYEQPPQGLIESPGQGRLALLNDLERELGQQETRRANMQLNLSRDSLSTLDMSSVAGSRRASRNVGLDSPFEISENLSSSSQTPPRVNIAAERRATRRARMASLASIRSSAQDTDFLTGGSRASLWQRRLEKAQMEYEEYANELAQRRSTNYFSKADLGSPTPPDSDESGSENETWQELAAILEAQAKQQAAARLLWTPPEAPEERSGLLWVRPEKPYEQHLPCQDPPLPGLSVRPTRRMENATMSIESTGLWKKPTPSATSNATGLWMSSAGPQQVEEAAKPAPAPKKQTPSYYNPSIQRSKTAPRPVTQRPPRRSKRITTLPDILEDPQPLPDKRGTLGIFQFPWGERSDVASIQPRPAMFMAMPGTMSTRGPIMPPTLGSNIERSELEDYSTSFFDDYDEDEDEDDSDYSNEMDSDSDDEGFDESTLWEIASLLKAENVPSRDSMFPSLRNSYMVSDYITEEQGQYDQTVTLQTILDTIDEPEGLQEMPSPLPPSPLPPVRTPKRTQSVLWEATRETEEALTQSWKGLPQPEDWQEYNQMAEMETARSKTRLSVQPAAIESDELWTPTPTPREIEGSKSPMWAPPRAMELPTPTTKKMFESPNTLLPEPYVPREAPSKAFAPEVVAPKVVESMPLWKPEQQPGKGEHGVGLPQPQDWNTSDSINSSVRARPRLSEPAAIESVNMWQSSPSSETQGPKNWLQLPRAIAASTHLWQPKEQKQKGDHGVGLPSPQNWGKYDMIEATIRTKPRREQIAAIESEDLWQASQSSTRPRNWLLFPRAVSATSRLWQVNKRPQRGEHSVGLPHPSNWESYAGIMTTIRSKPRQSEPAAIESVDLWQAQVPEVSASPSRLWAPKMRDFSAVIKQGFSHLERPHTMKLLWSFPSPKMAPSAGGLFDPRERRSDFRTTPLAPAAALMERKPRPFDRRPLDQLTSTTLWDASGSNKTEINWISSMRSGEDTAAPELPASDATSVSAAQSQTLSATDADWEAALQDALAASYPEPQHNVTASPEQWDEALNQAIAASYPQ